MYHKKNIRKSIAILLAFIIAFVICYLISFEAAHLVHNCIGEHCPICHELILAESMTKQISAAAVVVAAAFFMVLFIRKLGAVTIGFRSKRNLITDKVRIDD